MREHEQGDRELSPEERAALGTWEHLTPPPEFADRVLAAWTSTGTDPQTAPPPKARPSRRRVGLVVALSGMGLAASALLALSVVKTARPGEAVLAPGTIGGEMPEFMSRGQGVTTATPVPASPAPARASEAADGLSPRQGRGGVEQDAPRPRPPLTNADDDSVSTFAIDVDTGSYSMVRRAILEHFGLPREAVRVEELLNYFHYRDPPPTDGRPFAVSMEAAPSPWSAGRDLVRIALRAREVPPAARKPAHLVFLVDVSGSMSAADKLPLAQQSLRILTEALQPGDTVALVTYASGTRVVLQPTGMEERGRIFAAIDELSAGGSTAMGSGLELAYELAVRQVREGTISRVIVLSDGDANVGATSHDAILARIRGYVSEGVTLSTVGFGTGNYRDDLMEQLADRGNGNYTYVDRLSEARRVFVEQLSGTLEVVAQDVKVQVEWNPAAVRGYRLVGYENRRLADQDFRNDRVDAGEIGAGHSVTALYEIERVPGGPSALAVVRLRAKRPGASEATEDTYPFDAERLHASFADASDDLRFAAAVMGFSAVLRGGPEANGIALESVRAIARAATRPGDRDREELLELIDVLARQHGEGPVR